MAEHSRTADLFADRYSDLADDPFRTTFTYSRMRLDALMEAKLPTEGRGSQLLDVGCGTGHQLRAYRERGFEVVGVDGSEEMLRHARENNEGAEIRRASVDALPFPDASFDVVICIEVLRYLPDPQPCLREIQRVLRPGGRALITATPLFNLNGYAIVNRLALIMPQRSLTRLRQFFVTGRRLRAHLEEAGFCSATIYGVYFGPLNWVQRLLPGRTPAILRKWKPVDEALADRPVVRELSNMFLIDASV